MVDRSLVNLQSTELKVFRDLIDGEYHEELTLTTGSIQSRSFPDTIVDVLRLLKS
jgi:hypothetical protein